MREVIRGFVSIIARTLPVVAPIYGFGSPLIPGPVRHRCGPGGEEPALKRPARACAPPIVWSLLAAALRAAKGRG